MADVKISGMTPGTALTGAELFESVQTAATVSLTAPQLKAYTNQSGYTYNVPIAGFSLTSHPSAGVKPGGRFGHRNGHPSRCAARRRSSAYQHHANHHGPHPYA